MKPKVGRRFVLRKGGIIIEEEIRVLAVSPHWAYFILKHDKRVQDKNIGLKKIEIRSTDTHKGKIAIYVTKHKYTQKEVEGIEDWFVQLENRGYLTKNEYGDVSTYDFNKDKGYIVGTVEIAATSQVVDLMDFYLYTGYHLAPEFYFRPDKTYFWWLINPVVFDTPIKYTPPRGAVVWSKTVLPEG